MSSDRLRTLGKRLRPAVSRAADAVLRLDSTAAVSPRFDDGRMQGYQASYWLTVPLALRDLPIRADDAFVDLGCGKGRALYLASWYPFGRIVGVEKDPALADVARHNTTRGRGTRRLRRVEVVCGDARSAELPPSLRVAFLFNPFRGAVLEEVVRRVRDHARAEGRPVRLIYANPTEAATVHELGFQLVHRSRHCDVYDYEGGAG
ncbi:class I SAM-dependent methyltransferase [Pseudonocardia phyllosphaerae]|uniref:class I SAM-dependent methyltransferase n=1 Tax=Pseudonocardia phyllosphaerae TaxID=3390502 RepID=UPI00397A4909